MNIMLLLITLLSLAVAGTMSVVAWRVAREARLRSEARVAALAADIRAESADRPAERAGVVGPASMFASVQPSAAFPRLAAVVVAGALVVGGGAALVVALGRGEDAVSDSASGGQPRPGVEETRANTVPQATPALELVTLGHQRDDNRLAVRGIVRNPANGSTMNQLSAAVLLFSREGALLSSARAPVQVPTLGPGGESTFLVTVPGAASIGRYRVSFRSEERVVPHVDVRN